MKRAGNFFLTNATEMLWHFGHPLVMAAVVNTVFVPKYRILITQIWTKEQYNSDP